MIRFGNITEFDADTMRARVQFPEDEIVSDWLAVLTPGSGGNQYKRSLTTNEHVVVWIDEHADDGVVLGSIFDDNNLPPADAGAVFSDGLSITIEAGVVTITKGTTTVAIGAAGVTIERGGDSLGDALGALIDAIKLITVTCASPGSPSTTPINFAAFDAVAVRLNNILE